MVGAFSNLGDVYIMDHEVVPRPCKICDWLLNPSWATLVYTKEKIVKVTMEFEVPKRHILRPTLSIDMVQRVLRLERQKRCSSTKRQGPMAEERCYYDSLTKCLLGEEQTKTRENMRMVKLEFFSKLPF